MAKKIRDKHYYMQFVVKDYLGDDAVASCSPATRGIWVDLFLCMHQRDRCGRLTEDQESLARIGRCTVEQLKSALTELKLKHAADVTFRNGLVTVTNRRMRREYELRNAARLRQQKHRNGNADVTGKNADIPEKPETRVDSGKSNQSPERSKPAMQTDPPSGSGVSKKRGALVLVRTEKPHRGKSADLDDSTLRNVFAFRLWVDGERVLKHGLTRSDEAVQLAWASRAKAMTPGAVENPTGFVKSQLLKLRKGDGAKAWSCVTAAHGDAGRAAMREATGQTPSPVAGVLGNFGAMPQ